MRRITAITPSKAPRGTKLARTFYEENTGSYHLKHKFHKTSLKEGCEKNGDNRESRLSYIDRYVEKGLISVLLIDWASLFLWQCLFWY